MIAITDAGGGQDREQTVRGCLADVDMERLAKKIDDGFLAKHPADHPVAGMDDIFPDRFAVNKVVEGGQLIDLQRRHVQKLGRLEDGLVSQVSVVSLKRIHHIDDLLTRLFTRFNPFSESFLQFLRYHGRPYRALSRST